MATATVKLYTRGLTSIRSLTKKTIGTWQDTNGEFSQRQPDFLDNRFFHSKPDRPSSSREGAIDSRIGETIRLYSNACNLQFAKFKSDLERLEKDWIPKSSSRDDLEAAKWPAKVYQHGKWAMKLEPVLTQMANGHDFRPRPTVFALLFGSKEYSFFSSQFANDTDELEGYEVVRANSATTIDNSGLNPAKSVSKLMALLEGLHFDMSVATSILRQPVEYLHKQIILRVDPKPSPGVLITTSIFHARFCLGKRPHARNTRPFLHLGSPSRHDRIQRAYFHSAALKLSHNETHLSVFAYSPDRGSLHNAVPAESRVYKSDGPDPSIMEASCSSGEDVESTDDAEDSTLLSDECELGEQFVDPEISTPYSLSPYMRMFGEVCPEKIFQLSPHNELSACANQGDDSGAVVPQYSEPGNARSFNKEFSNNTIGGSARVHLGDLYYDHVTINQFYVLQDAGILNAEQLDSLRGFAGTFNHPVHAMQVDEGGCLKP